MESATNPTDAACDCPCPVHHGKPRHGFRHDGCLCTIVCSSQPVALLVPEWAAALFLTAEGDLWHVAVRDMPPAGTHLSSPTQPHLGEHTSWDWNNAGPIHQSQAWQQNSQVIAALIEQLATAASISAGDALLPADTGAGVMPPICYSGVIEDGTGGDDLIPSMAVLGHTEEEVYRGIFLTIAASLTEGVITDLPQWWLEENPLAEVDLNEPGAAQEWLEGFQECASYPYWTVLRSGSILDMRQQPTRGQ